MASIAQVTVRFGVDLKDFTTKMQKATKQIQAVGRTMQNTGRNLSRNLTLPVLALGGAATKLAVDFDESMTKIQTLVGVSADVVSGFKKEVLDLAGRTAKAPAELADALFTVTSAGLRGAEAMQVLEMASKGSAVGMGETKEIARAVTAVMQAYGTENVNAAQAMDILTATVRAGNLEASELAPVLGRVVGVAAQLGVGFDEVGASIATFTRLGVDSAEAVTALRGFLSGVLKPSSEARDALQGVGKTFADLRSEIKTKGLAQTLVDLVATFDGNTEALAAVIPNVRALAGVLGTAGRQSEAYLQIQKELSNSTGILNKAFEDTSKSGAFRMKQALNQLKQIGTDIGGILLPVVANLGDRLKELFGRFNNLSREMKEGILKFAALGAAIGPVVFVVGSLITSFGGLLRTLRALSAFLIANPWFALAGAIGAVVTGLVGYNKISSAFSGASNSATEAIKKEKAELNALVGVITDANITNEARATAINTLNEKYPDFLDNIGEEKASNEDLLTKLKEVNKEYEKKIIQQAAEEETARMLRARIELQKEEMELVEKLSKAKNTKSSATAFGGAAGLGSGTDPLLQQNKLNRLLRENRSEQEKINTEYAKALEFYNSIVPKVEELKTKSSSSGSGPGGGPGSIVRELFEGAEAQMKPLKELGDYTLPKIIKDFSFLSNQAPFDAMTEKAITFKDILSQSFGQIGGVLTETFVNMLDGSQGVFRSLGQFILRLTKQLAGAAIAAAVLSALLPGGGGKVAQGAQAASTFKDLFANFAGFRAAGGPVSAGSGYIVGENGPEYFRPSSSGTIIPNHALGGGSQNIQVQVVGAARLTYDGAGLTALIDQENIRITKFGG